MATFGCKNSTASLTLTRAISRLKSTGATARLGFDRYRLPGDQYARADYLVKGSHVYQNTGTSYPIVIYVTGPDGTSALFATNNLDSAAVSSMPSGIAGTRPSAENNGVAPANVQIDVSGGYGLTSYAGVGFQENDVATFGRNSTASPTLTRAISMPKSTGATAPRGIRPMSFSREPIHHGGLSRQGQPCLPEHRDQLSHRDLCHRSRRNQRPVRHEQPRYRRGLAHAQRHPRHPALRGKQRPGSGQCPDRRVRGIRPDLLCRHRLPGKHRGDLRGNQQPARRQPERFPAQINWGDSASWQPTDIVYEGTNTPWADYLVKGSHIYEKTGTDIPIVIYVTGPDGTSVLFATNNLDSSTVLANPNPYLIGDPGTSTWTAGQSTSVNLNVAGGSGGYGNLQATGLPPGLNATLTSGVVTISGSPLQSGTFPNVEITLQDSNHDTGSGTYTITVNPASSLQVIPPALPAGTVSQPYNTTIAAIDGSAAVDAHAYVRSPSCRL